MKGDNKIGFMILEFYNLIYLDFNMELEEILSDRLVQYNPITSKGTCKVNPKLVQWEEAKEWAKGPQ